MFRVGICRTNVHLGQITLKADKCMWLSLKDCCSGKGLCSHGARFHRTPARSLGAVHIKNNGRGTDKIIKNINWPFFKAVVNPVCNLLISCRKWYSRVRRGGEKSSRGNRHDQRAVSGPGRWEGMLRKGYSTSAIIFVLSLHIPRCPLLDTECRVKWTSGLTKDSNSWIVL